MLSCFVIGVVMEIEYIDTHPPLWLPTLKLQTQITIKVGIFESRAMWWHDCNLIDVIMFCNWGSCVVA